MKQIKISEVLQREFQNRGLSCSKVSKEVGIPKRTLQSWYSGSNIPSGKTLAHTQSLAEYLKISLHHLLFNEIDKETNAEVLVSLNFKDGESQTHYLLTIQKMTERD